MPCDSIETSSVKLELRADNQQFLVAALKSLKYSVWVSGSVVNFRTPEGLNGTLRGDQLTVTGRSGQPERFDVNPIKRAYSREVVTEAAEQYGWKLSETADFEFEVEKEAF